MKKLDKKITVIACVLAAVTIGIGAFGAHALKGMVDAKALGSFETGVRYQMYHVIALLIVGLSPHIQESTKKWSFRFFIFGMILFSGSIYFLSLNAVLPFDSSALGIVTPIGGLFFMAGWLRLAYGLYMLK